MSNNRSRQPGSGSSPLDPLLLQAYFDGELAPDEVAHVETALRESPDDRERLEVMSEMSELVRFDLEQRIEDVELGGLWSRIEPALDDNGRRALEAAASPAPPVREVDPRSTAGSWWSSVKAFFADHKAVFVPTMVAATVITLVVVPLLLNQAPPERVVERERTIVIVDEPLRFEGNSTGAVSYTPGTNTPVIWYLGEPTATDTPDEGAAGVGAADPALLRRQLSLPIPIDGLLERLERLERMMLPPGVGSRSRDAGAAPAPSDDGIATPPPVDDRSDRSPQDGPI